MKIKYMHLRHISGTHINPNGGMTVAYQKNDGSVIAFAAAKCSPRENYNKQQGRIKAEGRLKSEHYVITTDLAEKDFLKKMSAFWETECGHPGLILPVI